MKSHSQQLKKISVSYLYPSSHLLYSTADGPGIYKTVTLNSTSTVLYKTELQDNDKVVVSIASFMCRVD